jgi:hypothetical protein
LSKAQLRHEAKVCAGRLKIEREDGLCLTAKAWKQRGFATIMPTTCLTGNVLDAV